MDGHGRISRRELLRNAALAGAVAWVTPALTTVPAQAAPRGRRNLCKGILGGTCEDYDPCGSCGPFGLSLCFPKIRKDGSVSMKTACCEEDYCTNLLRCTVPSDCPTGYRCTSTCCGNVCGKKCSTPITGRPRHVRRLGRTSARAR